MSGFKTHLYGGIAAGLTTSTAFIIKDPSMFTVIQLSGIFLTGTIGGLLPDLDSDSSKPFSILFTLLSMIVPVLFFREISIIWLYFTSLTEPLFGYLSKLQPFKINLFPTQFSLFSTQFNLFSNQFSPFPTKLGPFPSLEQIKPEFIITYFVISYFLIRYCLCKLIQKITSHRGIMHSIPFALLCAETGFLIFIPSGKQMAVAVGISIFLGCITHLLLDELNSITLRSGFIPKLKMSSGSAMKLKSNSIVNTIMIYMLVIAGGMKIMELMGLRTLLK
ncbi:MAG: metal-dependent hydrolase [Desulfamplus sp.]|nr:metal-dependent hydrolase [Desulfamplus sp.]